ncbi:hypothetical protein KNU71_gp028 [Streptomyces phage Braelyn]|uniref:Uncharacterized protein n=1 Tax=Streptomyces phage Braelyn TaxID=2593356 RepID=A0A514U1S3_9CAUD|nr:hypothetical protein KNU71_gp028 [Streptomyces phage Braelyn]QDK02886.1 hypothetical protein SEA_BRAELYN_28 [Streptomyces phage Braelyn]UOW93461.1 hypothetical protein SEA_SQUILLIUM_28 [Streptomyces phage Squillium]WNM73293.1 hypothetical protein SEA_LIANDRY_28 [Streptomyces phage Liandry]WNM74691.1 hypothetical protein SEA_PINKIEPIE_28 [Streptomyces phage PinkiePie]
MDGVRRALNELYEKRRNAQRGADKAKLKGNRIEEQRYKREVRRLDGEIKNLESK